MKIFETLDRDPRETALANRGQARITTSMDERSISELRAELETFVCEGQYASAIERILQSYLTALDRPRQDAAWVSGFFGSGKSHLLKMLGHLWVDTEFPDGSTARSLVRGLSGEIPALLRELDGKAKRVGKPAFAAAGTLPAGSGEYVRMTVLSVILRACGLPEQYPQAQFCFWLREQGWLDKVRGAVESAGKDWQRELNNLYVSGLIAAQLLECDPNLAADEREMRKVLRERFPNPASDITTPEFLAAVRSALAPDGDLPLTILVLDEVQQYIGDSRDRVNTINEITEAVQTQLDSRVMLVASGQASLSGTPLLQWLRDRFRIPVQLSDADVEAVTRKVLLQKKPSAVDPIREMLERNSGEISKQLNGTRLAERTEDRNIIIEDYPLLPTRRRFWEECFRVIDAAGTHSQLRSQLRILHEALERISEESLGAVIPGDALFEVIAPDMVNTGVLLNEIHRRISQLDDGTDIGRLRKRICGLVFLINKLPRDAGVDTGVRATSAHVADLLVSDLEADSGPLRKQVGEQLEDLAASGTLMKVGEEYRLQTSEGAEWDRAFRERQAAIRQQDSELALKRDQLLATQVQQVVGGIRLVHGEAKVKRTLHLQAGSEAPDVAGDQIVIWMRDAWSAAQKEVENDARQRGHEDPVVHVFLPKKADDELKARVVESEAARQVLEAKGLPAGDEGKEAYESMRSRMHMAEQTRDELVREIIAGARVYQGGGNEVFGEALKPKLEQAAEAAMARRFPRFAEGDHKRWEAALKRAREGADEPFRVLGWDKPLGSHPVAREVLAVVAQGGRGGDVRKSLMAAPFGWPKDAIDAALMALHRAGSLKVEVNGQPMAPGQLDQNKIQSAVFRPEQTPLGTTQKLALRGLFQEAGVAVRSGEEVMASAEYLRHLQALAEQAGGEPPLPAPPDTALVEKLLRLSGNERLAAMLEAKADLEQALEQWAKLAERANKRLPQWRLIEELAGQAAGLESVEPILEEIEALRSSRALLEDSDHVTPLLSRLTTALRAEVIELSQAIQTAHADAMQALETDDTWQALDAVAREQILNTVGLQEPAAPEIKTDETLRDALRRQSLAARRDALAAIPGRVGQALEEAARRLEPTAQRVPLRTATLNDEEQVRQWLAEHEQKLIEAVAKGPVIVG